MAEVQRTKFVEAGGWRTLEYGWNASFACRFFGPAGAKVKVRYGDGPYLGWNSQEKTLDGNSFQTVSVGNASVAYARVQMNVEKDTQVSPRQDILYLCAELTRPCLGNICLTSPQSRMAPRKEPLIRENQRM